MFSSKNFLVNSFFYLSALLIGYLISQLFFRPKEIEYLDVMIKPKCSSLRDYPDRIKDKTRIYCNGAYVTFDEYEDIQDAERSRLAASSSSSHS